jgi:hypothetical protein
MRTKCWSEILKEGKLSFRRSRRRQEGSESVVWMNLAQDRDQWRAPANTVMNLQIREIILSGWEV